MSRYLKSRNQGRQYRVWIVALCTVMLLVNLQHLPTSSPVARAAGVPCIDDGPSGGSFVVRLCFTTPSDGAVLGSSPATTAVTVTPVSGTMPALTKVMFYLTRTNSTAHTAILSDLAAPYTMQIPTTRWVNGNYRLEAKAYFVTGFITEYASLEVTINSGVTVAPSSDGSWAPATSSGSPLNVVAVGDGAGGLPGADVVGALVGNLNPDLFFYLGDVYNSGTYSEFYNYYEPTLGQLKGRTNPVPGNHESPNGFKGYLDYWNTNQHYYSFESGGWRFISLDTTTQFGQTAAGSTQYNWLSGQLSTTPLDSCTLVLLHHPRWGLGASAGNAYLQDIWALMASSGVDVVLAGHEHNYQRWLPMDANGVSQPGGTVQYVVGTGGHELMGFGTSDSRTAYRLRQDGALQLTLGSSGGTSRFVTSSGAVVDESSFTCNGQPPPPPPPPPVDPNVPLTLNPVADSFVQQTNPDTNLGSNSNLRSDSIPNEMAYLKYDVQGLTFPVGQATLRFYVRDGTANAPAVVTSADTAWSEATITWSNRPSTGSTVADQGVVATGAWLEYDVTIAITGNGVFTFALSPQSSDALSVNSRENPIDRPELVITQVTASPTATSTETVTPTSTVPPGGSATLAPVADAFVQQNLPDANTGSNTNLRSDGSPVETAYLKFDVQGLTGPATSATLRMYVRDGTANGPSVSTSADSSWSESGITWNNRPATGPELADIGAVSTGTWKDVDVTSAITGNGLVTFVLVAQTGDALSVNSRNSGTDTPHLIISQGETTATPTATETETPTPAPTETPVPTVTPTVPPTPVITGSVNPVADAFVQQNNPDVNAGTGSNLRADGSPVEIAYLKFDVQGLSQPVTSATLRVYVRDGTVNGPEVAVATDSSWSETGITWNNRPIPGPAIADAGAIPVSTWFEYDVTAAITGNGIVTLVLISQSNDALSVNSRNAASERPELIITQGSASATPTATPSETATPTQTVSAPATATPTETATVPATETPVPTETPTIPPTATETVPPTEVPTEPPTATPTVEETPTETPTEEAAMLPRVVTANSTAAEEPSGVGFATVGGTAPDARYVRTTPLGSKTGLMAHRLNFDVVVEASVERNVTELNGDIGSGRSSLARRLKSGDHPTHVVDTYASNTTDNHISRSPPFFWLKLLLHQPRDS